LPLFAEDAEAATCIVCRMCGTEHLLAHCAGGVQDELYAYPEPRTVAWSAARRAFVLEPGSPGLRKYPGAHAVRPVRRSSQYASLEGIEDRLNLDRVACVHCGRIGRLITYWPPGERKCPRCGLGALQAEGSWVS
jgi:hypothetical protein